MGTGLEQGLVLFSCVKTVYSKAYLLYNECLCEGRELFWR